MGVAYLVLTHGLDVEQALDRVRSARPQAAPNEGFLAQLAKLQPATTVPSQDAAAVAAPPHSQRSSADGPEASDCRKRAHGGANGAVAEQTPAKRAAIGPSMPPRMNAIGPSMPPQ